MSPNFLVKQLPKEDSNRENKLYYNPHLTLFQNLRDNLNMFDLIRDNNMKKNK